MADKNKEKQDIEEQIKINGPVEFEKSKDTQEAEEKFEQKILN